MVIMKKLVFFISVIATIFSGCAKDELGGAYYEPLPEGKVRLTLNTNMGSFNKPIKTRAGVADENNMGDKVWAFVLEKLESTSSDYTLRVIEQLDMNESGDVNIIANRTTNPVTIVLLANAPNKYVDENGVEQDFTLENLSHITSYSELKQTLNTATLASPALSVPYTPDGAIPMSGDIDLPTGINTSLSSLTIQLQRIVAKISVETELDINKFELLMASVCNAPRSGWLLSPKTLWRDNSANLTNYNYNDIGCVAIQIDSKQTTATNPIYIYESRAEEQTAVIVEGIYGGNKYFYKLAMTSDYSVIGGTDTQLKPKNFYYRNFAYKYIITSVTGDGYSTFQEACDGAPSNNIKSAIDVIDLTSHDIIDNGEYFLGVSNSEYIIYATGGRSNLIAVTLSSGGNPALLLSGTVTASEGITITKGATFGYPLTGNEVEISVTDDFSIGTITIKMGNLKKTIAVSREYTTPFDGRNITKFGTSEYVAGKIESVSDNSLRDWIGVSPMAKGTDFGRRDIVNNNGGIYIHLGVNWDKSNGIAGRKATLYLSRKTNAGRVKVYLEQDYIDSRNIEDDERDLPENMDPVVGAFWRNNQIAERLILIRRPNGSGDQSSIDGYWYATTLIYGDGWDESHGDGIVIDTEWTKDPNVDFSSTAKEAYVLHGDQLESDQYYVTDTEGGVSGEMSKDNPLIYFRIGLEKTIDASKVRYAVLLLSYTYTKPNGNTQISRQRIFIRQGQADDYIMRPSDNINGASRTLAHKWSPYNLTDPDGNSNRDMGALVQGNGKVALNGGRFTEYPSQAGYYFSFYDRMAFSPEVNTTNIIPMTNTFMMDRTKGRTIENDVDKDEVCPPGYHTPRDGVDYKISSYERGRVINSEVRQSLFINPVDGDRPASMPFPLHSDPENQVSGSDAGTIVGFYADSYSDRLMRQTPFRNNFVVRKESAVGLGSNKVAYLGRLFYNPSTYASIFTPYAGSIAPNSTGNGDSWSDGNNAPYYMGEHAVYGTSTKRLEYNELHASGYQMIYVGFAESTTYIPTLVAVCPWKIYSFANIRCVAND